MWTFIDTENITRIYNTKKKTTMKNVNLILSAMASLCMVFTGCSSDENLSGTDPDGRVALQVSSGIQTRAFDDQWEAGDKIGIFMLNNKQSTVADGYDNVPYRVESAGAGGKAFSPLTEVIYLPTDGSMRDFVAYYPYSADKVTDGVYNIDLTEQNPQKDIDFMTADKVTDKSRIDANVSFRFTHKLVKIVMDIKAGNGLTADDLKNLSVRLMGQPTLGKFNVLNDHNVTATSTDKKTISLLANADGTQAEGIVFPSENYNGMNFIFTTKSMGSYEWELNKSIESTKFEAGKKYEYTITVHRTGLSVTSSITDWLPGNGDGETGNAE